MAFNLMGALQGGLGGLMQATGQPLPQPQKSYEGQLLDDWVKSGIIKPQRAAYWLQRQQQEGISSSQILSSLTDEDFTQKPPSAEETRRKAEGEEAQKIASLITDTVNQRTGPALTGAQMPYAPAMGQTGLPSMQASPLSAAKLAGQNLPVVSPQAGIMTNLAQAGTPLDSLGKAQGLFPSFLKGPETFSPEEQQALDLRSRELDLRKEAQAIASGRERRLGDQAEINAEIAREKLGLGQRRLNLSEQKYLSSLTDAERRFRFNATGMIRDEAKNIAGSDSAVTNEHIAEAIQRLISVNPDFQFFADSVEREQPGFWYGFTRGWLGKPGVTLKSLEPKAATPKAPKAENHYGEWGL